MDSDEDRDCDETDFWIVETLPSCGHAMSLHVGLHASRDPRFVSIMEFGLIFLCE